MLDFENGRFTPEDLPVTFFPELTKSLFLQALPGEKLRFAHDSGQGYAWFFLEPVTLCDALCSMTVCFNGEEALYELRLSVLGEKAATGVFGESQRVNSQTIPANLLQEAAENEQLRDKTTVSIGVETVAPAAPWRPNEESAIKAANDQFLFNHGGFVKKNRNRFGNLEKQFAWGKVTSFYDDKGCSSDIIIRYGQKAEAEDGFQAQKGRAKG